MGAKRFLPFLASFAITGLLGACTQPNTGDEPGPSGVPAGLQRFLLFPNPIQLASGTFETDSDEYAAAYYRAIDPSSQKTTLAGWKAANSFGGDATTGTEHLVVFRDVKDLGYGRRMTGRRNADPHPTNTNINGSVAFVVENYDIWTVSSGGYSSLNVEAAVAQDTKWHIGTNAIEWSPSPCTAEDPAAPANPVPCNPNVKFAKFYNFSAVDGTRQLRVDLDGKGLKAMPGPCINCHGGRADPLTEPDPGGLRRFALVENSVSRKRGDTQARLQGLNVDSFEFSAQAGWTKADQQAKLKDLNQWVLCTYPGGGTVTGTSWGTCTRPAAEPNGWQGTAAPMIQEWYGPVGSTTMPNPNFLDAYIPSAWNTLAGQPLYAQVVAPFCRTCHIVRGAAAQSDIDFMTEAKFRGYADRIKAHVFDRGNMPLALIVYNDFWKSSAPQTLANYLNPLLAVLTPPDTATSTSGEALKPGRPIANPGPDRMVRTGANAKLSAAESLFATTYTWSLEPPNQAATITPTADPRIATFLSGVAGAYTARLTVGNGTSTDSKLLVVTVDNAFPDPATLTFANIRNLLNPSCTGCHAPSGIAPIAYTDFDRDGVGGYVAATDDLWFHKELTGRVNLTEIQASPLLRKPSGNHHAGGGPYPAGQSNYSILYNWILEGMP